MHSFGKIISLIIALELSLQIFSYAQFLRASAVESNAKPYHNWYTKQEETKWWSEEMRALIPVYHPFLGFIFKNINTPNIHIDDSGIRTTAFNMPKEGDTYKKIYFFGGSAMTGYGVKDNETIPSYIAQRLNTQGVRYHFFNYGQIRYNSNQELLFLLLQLKEGNIPDLVIFYDGFNDAVLTPKTSTQDTLNGIVGEDEYKNRLGSLDSLFLPVGKNSSIIDVPTIRRIGEFIFTRVKLIDYPVTIIRYFSERYAPQEQAATHEVSDLMIRKTVENYEKNARILDALSTQYHFKYLLLWQPLPQFKKLTNEEALDTEIPYYPDDVTIIQNTVAALHEKEIPNFYDLSDSFDNYAEVSVFMDAIHLAPAGNKIVAEKISGLIETVLR
jgi:lysophospholipase L1-like esterase